MGPAPTSPRALHGWALEASSCSFRLCRVEISVVRVLFWAKPCSALWDLRVECTFLKKKVFPFGCSLRASCYLKQGARGSCLEIALILRWNVTERVPGFFIKKNSDIARSGFFLSWFLEVVLSWRSLLADVRFFSKKKGHSLSVAPEPLAIWNKELEGLWILCCFKIADLKKSFEWCALFWKKSALTECSPRASCYLEQGARGSWILCCSKELEKPLLLQPLSVYPGSFTQKKLGCRVLAYSLVVCCWQMWLYDSGWV